MAELRLYRTYSFKDKDPIIDKLRTVLQDERLFEKLGLVHELSGVSTSTFQNWFHGETKKPQSATIDAMLTSLGYEREIKKVDDLDFEKERIKARRWREKHERETTRVKKRRVNGNGHSPNRRS